MRLLFLSVFALSLAGCTADQARAIQAMNAQYQYNQYNQAMIEAAENQNSMRTTNCQLWNNTMQCTEF